MIWALERASAVSKSFYYIETVRSVEDFLSCYIFLAPEPSVVSGFVELPGAAKWNMDLFHGPILGAPIPDISEFPFPKIQNRMEEGLASDH